MNARLPALLAALLAACAPGAQPAPDGDDGPDDCFAALGLSRPDFGTPVPAGAPVPVWCGGRLDPTAPAMTAEPPAPGVCRAAVFARDVRVSTTTYTSMDGRLVAWRTADGAGTERARASIERGPGGRVLAYREWQGGPDPAVVADYREDGRPLRFESPGGRAVFTYDDTGRLRHIEATDRTGTRVEEIDATGARTSLTTNGRRAETRYESDSYVTTEQGAETVRFACDAAAHMLWDRGRAQSRTFAYDAEGRLVLVRLPNGALGRYAYDDEDRVLRISTPSLTPGAPPVEETRAYDEDGRPLCVQRALLQPSGGSYTFVQQRTLYEYGPDGALRATRRDDGADGTIDAVVPALKERRDADGRPVERVLGDQRTVFEYDCD